MPAITDKLMMYEISGLICREMVIESRDALSIRASRVIAAERENGSDAARRIHFFGPACQRLEDRGVAPETPVKGGGP